MWKPSVNEDVSHLFEEKSQQLLRLCNTLPLEVVELGQYLILIMHYVMLAAFFFLDAARQF